jgi:virginiamycin B lyase
MWFVTAFSNEIGRMTLDGTVTNEWKTPTLGSSPRRLRIGPDGKTMWFTEAEGNNIGSVTTSGFIVEYPIPTPNSTPSGITAGPDGAIWFNESASSANQIVRMTTAGQFTNTYPVPSPDSVLGQIITGPDGNLWVTENGSDKIGRLVPPNQPGGGVLTEWIVPTKRAIPTGLIVAPDGAMWFTEFGSSGVGRITTQGVITEYPTGGSTPSVPWEIVVGSDGALWYAESESNAIGRVPDCALGLVASYSGGLLNLNFSLGVSSGANWTTTIRQNNVPVKTLWSKSIPPQLPLTSTGVQVPLGAIGSFSVLSGLFAANGSAICAEGQSLTAGN